MNSVNSTFNFWRQYVSGKVCEFCEQPSKSGISNPVYHEVYSRVPTIRGFIKGALYE